MNWETIRGVIAEVLGCDEDQLAAETRLREDLHADSLTAVELCMALEEACGITIDDALLPTFRTVGDILDYLNGHTE